MTADPPRPLKPGLHVVATPIGALRDMTLRALDTLKAADLVLAEDTRVTGRLLSAHGVKARLLAYHEHNAEAVRPRVMAALAEGQAVALVSDAGTPLISDPGYRLVREAAEAGYEVLAVPGASALTAALSVAGLPTDRVLFAGFPPPKSAARRTFFAGVASVEATLVFYEGVSRLGASLTDMAEVFGDREAAVARELTKLYETVVRGRLGALAADPALQAPKGEVVVVVAPPDAAAPVGPEAADAALRDALARLSPADAASEVADALALPRRDLYRRAIALKGEGR